MKFIGIGAAIILLSFVSCGAGVCLGFQYAFSYNQEAGELGEFLIGLGKIGLFGGTVVVIVGIVLAVKAMTKNDNSDPNDSGAE